MASFIPPQALLFLPVLLLSIICHEIAHAYAAYRGGDDTARLKGRLSLNPIVHIDPIGTILMPIIMMLSPVRLPLLAWAKPVPVNPNNLRSRNWDLVVSLAGVVVNLCLAILAMLCIKIFLLSGLGDRVGTIDGRLTMPAVIFIMLKAFVLVNLFLMAFNLIPVPPLDGSHVLFHFIRARGDTTMAIVHFLERHGFLILLALVYFGVLGRIIVPLVNGIIKLMCLVLAIPRVIMVI